ncbi:TetR/AcrR family transcriptional regulator [Actinopolymorpha pittospori]
MASHSYHHGDLRRALLQVALEAIEEHGPTALSLRDLARRAGVSHAAPAHHFGDKSGLLTALAAQGYDLLAEEVTSAYETSGSLADAGAGYVRFAVDHPAHFEVMFRPDLYDIDDEELVAARERAARSLRRSVSGDGGQPAGPPTSDPASLAAWSLAHGFATLLVTGNVTAADPTETFRQVAAAFLLGSAAVEAPSAQASIRASSSS